MLLIFLEDYLPLIRRPLKTILWETDSTTALSYIAKEGGTHSPVLLEIASKILQLAAEMGVNIVPVYVPSEENLHADFASRFKTLPDLHLRPAIFQKLCQIWGSPQIDLFATEMSAQLPRFYAWGEAPNAEAFDALSQVWTFKMAYAFPPLPLIPRVLAKIRQSQGIFILLTPFWPTRSWFPSLMQMNILDARRLPLSQNLVIDLQTGAPPPLLDSLRLVAWMISSPPMALTRSMTKHSVSCEQVGEIHQMIDTNELGNVSSSFCIPEEFRLIPSL